MIETIDKASQLEKLLMLNPLKGFKLLENHLQVKEEFKAIYDIIKFAYSIDGDYIAHKTHETSMWDTLYFFDKKECINIDAYSYANYVFNKSCYDTRILNIFFGEYVDIYMNRNYKFKFRFKEDIKMLRDLQKSIKIYKPI